MSFSELKAKTHFSPNVVSNLVLKEDKNNQQIFECTVKDDGRYSHDAKFAYYPNQREGIIYNFAMLPGGGADSTNRLRANTELRNVINGVNQSVVRISTADRNRYTAVDNLIQQRGLRNNKINRGPANIVQQMSKDIGQDNCDAIYSSGAEKIGSTGVSTCISLKAVGIVDGAENHYGPGKPLYTIATHHWAGIDSAEDAFTTLRAKMTQWRTSNYETLAIGGAKGPSSLEIGSLDMANDVLEAGRNHNLRSARLNISELTFDANDEDEAIETGRTSINVLHGVAETLFREA